MDAALGGHTKTRKEFACGGVTWLMIRGGMPQSELHWKGVRDAYRLLGQAVGEGERVLLIVLVPM